MHPARPQGFPGLGDVIRQHSRDTVSPKEEPRPTDDALDKIERDREVQRRFQEHQKAALGNGEGAAGDSSAFMLYCREVARDKGHPNKSVRALARIIVADPTWPGTTSRPLTRATAADHFRRMSVRPHLMRVLRELWDEYDAQARNKAKKSKSRDARKARKVTRRQQRR